MLVLSGKMGQRFVIDDVIVVEVGRRKGRRRTLTITASQEVRILREESGPALPQIDGLGDFTDDENEFGSRSISRKVGQAIRLEIVGQLFGFVRLVENKTNSVRLGFDFDNDIVVLRQKVFEGDNVGVEPAVFENPKIRELLPTLPAA